MQLFGGHFLGQGEIIIYNGGRLKPPGVMVPLHLQLKGTGAWVDECDAVQGLALSQTTPQTALGRHTKASI